MLVIIFGIVACYWVKWVKGFVAEKVKMSKSRNVKRSKSPGLRCLQNDLQFTKPVFTPFRHFLSAGKTRNVQPCQKRSNVI